MESAGAALRAVGGAAQIKLGKVARSEWKPQMRRGRKRRDVRGPGRRTRARRDDEGWRGVPRLRRVHQTPFGDAGKAAPTLDSQTHRMFLTGTCSRELPRVDIYRLHQESGVDSSWLHTHSWLS
jgi:hypothetical protein